MMKGWMDDEWMIDNRLMMKGWMVCPQNKYKEEGRKEMSSSLYSQLPETAEMQLSKAVQLFQSEVRPAAAAAA